MWVLPVVLWSGGPKTETGLMTALMPRPSLTAE